MSQNKNAVNANCTLDKNWNYRSKILSYPPCSSGQHNMGWIWLTGLGFLSPLSPQWFTCTVKLIEILLNKKSTFYSVLEIQSHNAKAYRVEELY